LTLFHRDYGSGHPLTILHGLLGSGGNWHTLSRSVFSESRRVVVADMRNHGKSPHDSRLDYEVMADDVVELWDGMGVEASDLMGHSMGGKVAMQLALTHPERVSRLVVVDMAPRGYQPAHEALFQALADAAPATKRSRAQVDAFLKDRIPDIGVRQFLLKNLAHGPDGLHWQMNLEAIVSNYDRILEGLTVFATYEGPTLFIRGGRSDYILDDDNGIIQAYFPQAQLVTIPGAGHWVHAEAPGPFADAVTEFLAG
jgi:esterase